MSQNITVPKPKEIKRPDKPNIQPADRKVMLAPDWHPVSCIDNFIFSLGWTWEPGGFVPPSGWTEKISIHYGRGRHWSRTLATQFCIQFYQDGHSKIFWPDNKKQ